MSTSETITDLFKQGVVEITIALSPAKNQLLIIKQGVVTGPTGNFAQVLHQIEGESLSVCLEAARKHVAHANENRTQILTLPRNGRG